MMLCAGSKLDGVVLVYTYEIIILITKTKAKSSNIKYYLVIYPKSTLCKHIFVALQTQILIQNVYVGNKEKYLKAYYVLLYLFLFLTFKGEA